MVHNQIQGTIKGARVKGRTKVTYDYNMSKNKGGSYQKVKPVKDGAEPKPDNMFSDGTVNRTNKEMIELTFNPYNLNAGIAGHELGHFGLRMLFTDNVMFKAEFVDGMKSVMEKIPTVGVDPKTGKITTLADEGI